MLLVILVNEIASTFIYIYQKEWTSGNDSEYQKFNTVCARISTVRLIIDCDKICRTVLNKLSSLANLIPTEMEEFHFSKFVILFGHFV
jgi:hypothetical protein